MKNFFLTLFVGLFVAVPVFAGDVLGGGDGGELGEAVGSVLEFVDSVIIPLILSIGFLLFVWGMFMYFIKGGSDSEAQEKGKSLILYAIAGFVVILAFWGIVNIISNGLGLEDSLDSIPSVQVD